MTNQEVITVLERFTDEEGWTEKCVTAHRIAINTLKWLDWISCEERLPECDKDVRVKLSNGIEFQGYYDGYEWNLGHSELMCLPLYCVGGINDETVVCSWKEL